MLQSISQKSRTHACRPHNSHDLTVRLTVSRYLSRSHGELLIFDAFSRYETSARLANLWLRILYWRMWGYRILCKRQWFYFCDIDQCKFIISRRRDGCLLGVKGRTGNCSSKEPGDEAIHGIVGVSRWATSAG